MDDRQCSLRERRHEDVDSLKELFVVIPGYVMIIARDDGALAEKVATTS